jgi:signal transduction histidine kinase
MSLSRWEIPALLMALGAAIASVVVLAYGGVDIGLTLRADNGRVYVADVIPDGIADRSGFVPGLPILDLTLRDGSQVKRGEPLGQFVSGNPLPPSDPWPMAPVARPLYDYGDYGPDFHPPSEAVAGVRIASIVGSEVDPDTGWIGVNAGLDRGEHESALRSSIWLLALGLAVGIGVWRFLVHGLAGDRGRERAVVLGAAAATPFLLIPVVLAGAMVGIAAGYAVPMALALLIGLALAVRVADPALRRTAVAGTLAAAALAGLYVVRHLTTFVPYRDDRAAILVLIAAITVVPAAILAVSSLERTRERAQLLSLSLVPAAAATAIVPLGAVPLLPLILLALLLGWQLLALQRASALVGGWWQALLPTAAEEGDGTTRTSGGLWRDRGVLALLGLVAIACLLNANPWTAIVGVGLSALVALAVGRGLLGADWTDAAIPLAGAVGLPILILPFPAWEYGGAMGWASAPEALVALSVAHLLAGRYGTSRWRGRLLAGSGLLAVLSVFLGAQHLTLALMVAGMVPLVPGLPVAFAEDGPRSRALAGRLEALVVALTPGVAATVLVPYTNGLLLGAWLVAVVIWRRFTLAPLLGLAQRTQLQRDLAVAAAETERARLAADLHDDALQQVTMLVRTLDEAGQADAANTAREVADKLRAIVGDLRLPILDDLGAGAALEWLVERVEPLAGGPVRLEQSGSGRPPANVELAVFRVAQEALSNAIKHGKPPVTIRYEVREDGRVTLAVEDVGPGIEPEAAAAAPSEGHFGLANMQQRAEQIGALLDVRRWPAGGTRVALEWRPA